MHEVWRYCKKKVCLHCRPKKTCPVQYTQKRNNYTPFCFPHLLLHLCGVYQPDLHLLIASHICYLPVQLLFSSISSKMPYFSDNQFQRQHLNFKRTHGSFGDGPESHVFSGFTLQTVKPFLHTSLRGICPCLVTIKVMTEALSEVCVHFPLSLNIHILNSYCQHTADTLPFFHTEF